MENGGDFMKDNDYRRLAEQFMKNTLGVQPGETVWIEHQGPKADRLARVCQSLVQDLSARAVVLDTGTDAVCRMAEEHSDDALQEIGKRYAETAGQAAKALFICDDFDQMRSPEKHDLKRRFGQLVRKDARNTIVEKAHWLVVYAPTEEFADKCNKSFESFEDFYLSVCLVDYKEMSEAAQPLVKLLSGQREVFIAGEETRLSFKTENVGSVLCAGSLNIPDGECFTAPVKESINGTIKFGPSVYDGQSFGSIKLTFENGKAILAEAENAERTAMLNKILDTDPGGRYVGEFAVAFNPRISDPMGNRLFDEKIHGSIHLALGYCYDVTPNGNKSAIHWDMVHIQRPDYGGGELWIDDRLIRKDGVFVVPELQALNPENLIGDDQLRSDKGKNFKPAGPV